MSDLEKSIHEEHIADVQLNYRLNARIVQLLEENARLRAFVKNVQAEAHERQIEMTLNPYGYENYVALQKCAIGLDKLEQQAAAVLAESEGK